MNHLFSFRTWSGRGLVRVEGWRGLVAHEGLKGSFFFLSFLFFFYLLEDTWMFDPRRIVVGF